MKHGGNHLNCAPIVRGAWRESIHNNECQGIHDSRNGEFSCSTETHRLVFAYVHQLTTWVR